ncbi:hypothetical protein Scep_020535 [Stephania cephalantha]|uniref:EF-hand domain-containing protein n=1 Tax=Stephania cephalantha TaxID=152367 RepID=A0AAP0ICT1_9MAGN
MPPRMKREDKVLTIFNRFDANKDGGLDRQEMASLVVSVNPLVHFSEEQITAILDEVFRTYEEFIDPLKGLTYDGLLRTYDDGAGDVDRDFEALNLGTIVESSPVLISIGSNGSSSSSSLVNEAALKRQRTAAWAASPNHVIAFESTWNIVDDVGILIKRLRGKNDIVSNGCGDREGSNESGGSREFLERRVVWDENGKGYSTFVKELGVLRGRADAAKSIEEAFDAHMAIGRILYESYLFKEALVSFKQASELQPINFRPRFRAGNCLYILERYREGKEEFSMALEAAELGGNQWSYILPQIHVNLGISLEREGMILSACEHYREAAMLCPTHFRALKLLGSALFGIGEYGAAEKALEEAIFLKPDYADAHCDLGSALHAIGDNERAIEEFQRAIDLKPSHVDALYNLGGLYMDVGRYHRASEMYGRVLDVCPSHWRAQLNKAVASLGAEETKDAKKALKEAFKMTNRVELHDAIAHLEQLQKHRSKSKGGGVGEVVAFVVVEPFKFKRADDRTVERQELARALEIREFQKLTRLNRCDVLLLRKEMNETKMPAFTGTSAREGSFRKAVWEAILRKLLHFLKPETFQGAVKAINQRIFSVLDSRVPCTVDLGMFFAVLAPICGGSFDKRKKIVFDALLWRPANGGGANIRKVDAMAYIRLLRAIYIPSAEPSEVMEEQEENDTFSTISYSEFLEFFDDPESGFGIMNTLVKLETGDRIRQGYHVCSVCQYPIIGYRFKEVKSHFNLCSQCYSEGKVPSSFNQEEYKFKEYGAKYEGATDKSETDDAIKQRDIQIGTYEAEDYGNYDPTPMFYPGDPAPFPHR